MEWLPGEREREKLPNKWTKFQLHHHQEAFNSFGKLQVDLEQEEQEKELEPELHEEVAHFSN